MKAERTERHKIASDIAISIFLYTTPVFLMLLSFYMTGARPWENYVPADAKVSGNIFIAQVFNHLASWGLPLLMVIVGIIEFAYGLYENRWSNNERILDIVCFILPKVVVGPF